MKRIILILAAIATLALSACSTVQSSQKDPDINPLTGKLRVSKYILIEPVLQAKLNEPHDVCGKKDPVTGIITVKSCWNKDYPE